VITSTLRFVLGIVFSSRRCLLGVLVGAPAMVIRNDRYIFLTHMGDV
jgi:hypothetical protein